MCYIIMLEKQVHCTWPQIKLFEQTHASVGIKSNLSFFFFVFFFCNDSLHMHVLPYSGWYFLFHFYITYFTIIFYFLFLWTKHMSDVHIVILNISFVIFSYGLQLYFLFHSLFLTFSNFYLINISYLLFSFLWLSPLIDFFLLPFSLLLALLNFFFFFFLFVFLFFLFMTMSTFLILTQLFFLIWNIFLVYYLTLFVGGWTRFVHSYRIIIHRMCDLKLFLLRCMLYLIIPWWKRADFSNWLIRYAYMLIILHVKLFICA